LTLRCTAPDVIETTVTWNSLDDVLRDNRPIGHFTFAKRTWNFGGCIFAETVAYDAAGRPEFSLAEAVSTLPEQGCGHESVFYSAWDAEGRPRQALLRMEWSRPPPINLCDEQQQSYAYDDDANQFTTTRSGGIGEGCDTFAMTSTFDLDGLLLNESYQTNGSRPNERAYTTLETGAICRD
jgi:hypothetical protein